MAKITDLTESELQELGRKLVDREVIYNVSTLVSELSLVNGVDGFEDAFSGVFYEENGEELETEIYEHWLVSEHLANKLEAKNERVIKPLDLFIWCRPTTGQSICLDNVIQEIAFDMWGN